MELFQKIDRKVLSSIKTTDGGDDRKITPIYKGYVGEKKVTNTNLKALRALGARNITNRNGTKLPS